LSGLHQSKALNQKKIASHAIDARPPVDYDNMSAAEVERDYYLGTSKIEPATHTVVTICVGVEGYLALE
jgi:hypothetical protein